MPLRWKEGSLFLLALLACVLLGCSSSSTAGSGSSDRLPVITVFSVSANPVDAGDTVVLDWAVAGASSLVIDNGVGPVTGRSSLTVTPAQTTTYTLTAANAAGSVSAKATVTVKVTVSLDQTALVVTPGSTRRFAATVKGSSTGVAWSVQESGGGWVTADGVYLAPSAAGVYHLQASSLADATAYAQATITVDDVGVSVLPGSAALATQGSLTLTATVSGASTNSGVTWSVVDSGGGTLVDQGNNTALYTAPAIAGAYRVLAASVEDPTKTATVILTVNQVAVAVSPVSQTVLAGASQQYVATVTGSSNTAVTWSVLEGDGGRISSSGLYTAPTTAGTYHIQASSLADASVAAAVPVTVELVGVSISPALAILAPGGSQQFAATVAGTANTQVTWQVQEPGGGQIDGNGSYTAPAVTGTYHVSAYSVADPTQSAMATISVPTRTLVVSLGTGASGTPSVTTSAVQGQVISYNYAAAPGYSIQVLVDGVAAPATGAIVMGQDHSITVATGLAPVITNRYTLTTAVAGAVGVPVAGSIDYAEGTVVAYSYALQSGFANLMVTLDGSVIPASGTLTMNANHTITVAAVPGGPVSVSISPALVTLAPGGAQQFAATVAGTANTQVTWQVQEPGGGQIDGNGSYTAPAVTGTYHVSACSVADPTQSATATISVPIRTLGVSLGTGASGTPSVTTSAVQGQVIIYNYAAAPGYSIEVLVDGVAAPATGAIVMDQNHSITVAARLAPVITIRYTLTTTVEGAVGAPLAGSAEYAEGTVVAYSYALQSGFTNLMVTLDGSLIPASGTLTMNGNHTLRAVAGPFVVVPIPTYTLTVNLGPNTFGIPAVTTTYNEGTAVTYVYALKASAPAGSALSVLVDGLDVSATGSLTMNANHTITVAAAIPPLVLAIEGFPAQSAPTNLGMSYVPGSTHTFVARASGGLAPYSYQWVPIGGPSQPITGSYVTFENMSNLTVSTTWTLWVTDHRGIRFPQDFWLQEK